MRLDYQSQNDQNLSQCRPINRTHRRSRKTEHHSLGPIATYVFEVHSAGPYNVCLAVSDNDQNVDKDDQGRS